MRHQRNGTGRPYHIQRRQGKKREDNTGEYRPHAVLHREETPGRMGGQLRRVYAEVQGARKRGVQRERGKDSYGEGCQEHAQGGHTHVSEKRQRAYCL